jgi:hypothetical protein
VASPIDDASPGRGAYGFRLLGITESDLLNHAEADWKVLELAQASGRSSGAPEYVGRDDALIKFRTGGEAAIERDPCRAVITKPRPLTDDELVHPYLAPIAAVASFWLGRESFHAGGIVGADGVWGVLGDRRAGKSTLLAWLAQQGFGVFCDDVLVLDGHDVLAGPRSIDLREDASRELGAGEPLGRVGRRLRWRLTLPAVEGRLPLRGWILLRWGRPARLSILPPSQRVPVLAAARAVRIPPQDPAALLRFAALPMWEIRRPRGFEATTHTGELAAQAAGVRAPRSASSQSD